jgi:predicted RNA-binding protein associated with RNAse of E/G family
MNDIFIHKLDPAGQEVWQYPGKVVSQNNAQIVLEAIFDREFVEIGGLHLSRGDRFVETFYFDRWYNIFEIYDALDGRLKGWYCNITRPAWMESNHLYAEDLALDLVVHPDHSLIVLDEDEFEGLVLPEQERIQAQTALEELIQLARSGQPPFTK